MNEFFMPLGKKFSKMGVSPIGSTALKFLLVSILLLVFIGSAHAELTATGGTMSWYLKNDQNIIVHKFDSNSVFSVTTSGDANILVVAGGGAGGLGGGGAGGLIFSSNFNISTGDYNVIIGQGGVTTGIETGTNGGNSVFSTLIAIGGGKGATNDPGHGNLGGSGGGGFKAGFVGGAGTAGQGYAGGNGYSITYGAGGGGGGAGQVGENGSVTGAKGGDGLAYDITGTSIYYAGGGGGSGDGRTNWPGGAGGLGGGGAGAGEGRAVAIAGTNGLGGGGGGASYGESGFYTPNNGGSGIIIIAYSAVFDFVTAGFDYVVTGTQVDLNDTSIVSGDAVIDSWEWLIDDVSSSTDQNYSFTGVEATDYNVCLIIQDTTLSLENSTCQTISISDITPPTTTFSYEQISGTTDTNITLSCTDNNSGCQYINFRINNGDWNYYTIGDNPLNIIYSGAGLDHNIQFYSTDNADNNEPINTSTFSTYGLAKFAFYDEDTEALLNDVVWTVSPSINGVSGGTLTDSNVLDLNLQGITSQEYLFTFSLDGYGTRYYRTELNQYSDIDLNFALLSTTLSDDIPFKIYQTDETTIYTNTIVELYRPDNNFVIGRKKTNSTGNVTFSIHVSDQNYYVRVDDGAFTYQPVALTIYYPKNEETLLQITEDWKIEITQNLYETYSDLNTNKIIYLLPNTSLPFNIRISDMNGNFFTRTYAQQFFGDPRTAELQPYLVSTTTGLLNTITTKDATTNTNIGGVTIKIYKFISGEGRTLVEQVITDAKGQAITLLIAGAEYSFETYYGGVLIKTFEITSTSTTIFIMLDLGSIIEVPEPSGYQATFTPKGTGLINQGVGTVQFTQTMYNYGGKTVSLTSRILQGGVVISQQTANTSLTSYTFTHTINWVDINQTTITSRIIINDGTTNYTFNQDYTITTFFDTNYSILDGLQNGLRRDMTCDANGICFPLLALAIFISIALVIGATIGIGQFGVQSVAIIFLSSMMLFTYLNWVPFILTIVLAVLTFAFIVSERSV